MMNNNDKLDIDIESSASPMEVINREFDLVNNVEDTIEENDAEDVRRLDAISTTILLPDVQNDEIDVSEAEETTDDNNNTDDNDVDDDDDEEVDIVEEENDERYLEATGQFIEEQEEEEEKELLALEEESVYHVNENCNSSEHQNTTENYSDYSNDAGINLHNTVEKQNDDDANEEEQQGEVSKASFDYQTDTQVQESLHAEDVCLTNIITNSTNANNSKSITNAQQLDIDDKLDLGSVFSFSRVRDLMKLESSVISDGICNDNSSPTKLNSIHHDGQSAIIARDAVRATCEAVALMLQDLCRTASSEAIRRKRKTISYDDIARAVTLYDRFAYLANIIPTVSEAHRIDTKGNTSKTLHSKTNATNNNVENTKPNSTAKPCETSSNKENVELRQMRLTSLSPSSALTNAPFGLSNQRYATSEVKHLKHNVHEEHEEQREQQQQQEEENIDVVIE